MVLTIDIGGNKVEMATYLSQKQQEFYARSNSGVLSEEKKKCYRELAVECDKYSAKLTHEAFFANTVKFNAVKDDLDEINTDIKNRFDELESKAKFFENVATVLKIIDQGIEIAAGVMK